MVGDVTIGPPALKVHFRTPGPAGPGDAYTPVRALLAWKVVWASDGAAAAARIASIANLFIRSLPNLGVYAEEM